MNESGAPKRAPERLRSEWERSQAERAGRWRNFSDDMLWHVDRSAAASPRSGAPTRSGRHWPVAGEHESVAGPGGTLPTTKRVAFIRIDFLTDRGGSASTGDGRFDLSGPDTTQPPVDRPPRNRAFYKAHFEALKRYYEAQSYGLVRIEGDVWPRSDSAYSVSDMADLGPWSFGPGIYEAAVHMTRTMLFAADSQSVRRFNDRIPWDSYDRIVIIHAGSDLQSDVRQDSHEDIPSFTIGVPDSDAVIFPDSTTRPIDRVAFIPETGNQDGYFAALNGVIAHECGHLLFGFFDVYNVNSGLPTVGFWSLMDYGNGVGSILRLQDGSELFAVGLLPPSIDPWHKFRFMLNDEVPFPEVAYGDTMVFRAIERHPDLRKVTLSTDEYLMIENRYLAPADSVHLDQDSTTRVVLGPKEPDRFEYDALLPGGGLLVWHVDESVLPNEFVEPCDSTRANPDCGLNSNSRRPGLDIIEADALNDLGDPGSPYLLGSPFDPYFKRNNPSLSDTTAPNLIPHIGTRPHVRLDFLDNEPDSVMGMSAVRTWMLPNWPITADFPPEGPILLAVDANGDRNLEVCWAGGDTSRAQANALFAVRPNGLGLFGPAAAFFTLDRRPLPVMAALSLTDEPVFPSPTESSIGGGVDTVFSYFAATTFPDGPNLSTPGGRVWLIQVKGDHAEVAPGWPAALPAIATTPPVIAGGYPNVTVYVGCADGHVYAIGLNGTVISTSQPALSGGIRGRLAVAETPAQLSARNSTNGFLASRCVAAGGANGDVGVFAADAGLAAANGWPQPVGPAGFEPDFLWIDFNGDFSDPQKCPGGLSLIVHHADRLWGYCLSGPLLPGWGHSFGDTLVSSLGGGDPDGDGFPEVLIQTIDSRLAFINLTGYPSPGWPKKGTPENFRTDSPPLAVDLDGDDRSEVIGMNASGIIAALKQDGKAPAGWPLATGLGAIGAPVIADLDRDGTLELVAPDSVAGLYGYSLPSVAARLPQLPSWTMLGGDPGRNSALRIDPSAQSPRPQTGPLVQGSLKVYPNPARRRPVSFAYRLTEPADVEFRILDTSGHEVASFSRRGIQADNLEIWDPGRVPAGLYVARLKFKSGGGERVETVPLGLLR